MDDIYFLITFSVVVNEDDSLTASTYYKQEGGSFNFEEFSTQITSELPQFFEGGIDNVSPVVIMFMREVNQKEYFLNVVGGLNEDKFERSGH